MKKTILLYLIVSVGLLEFTSLQAQTLIDNYRFNTWVDTSFWIDIAGVDSVLVATPTGSVQITSGSYASLLTNIGFTFPFAGTDYTTFGTNLMGAIRLGARIVNTQSGSNILPVASTLPKVDGLGVRGMADSTCYIRCATVGTEGNRVLVIETRLGIFQHNGTYVCWQTQLWEATGEVRLVYGQSTGINQMPATQPGLATSNRDMLFLDFANHTVVRYASTPVPVNAAGVWPEKGRCYSFVPDSTVCPAPPTVTILNNDSDSTVIVWPAVSGCVWRLRIPVLEMDTIITDTVLLLSGINPTTAYSGTIQTVCGVDDTSLRVRQFGFTTGCGTVQMLPWNDDFQLATIFNCWSNSYETIGNRWQLKSDGSNKIMRTGYSNSATTVYNEWLISPPVELPTEDGLTLRWDYKCERYNTISPKVCVRLLVCDTTDNVDTNDAWVTLATIEDYEQNFQTHHLRLDTYAGHRVRVAFQRYGKGGKYAYVDNVGFAVQVSPIVELLVPDFVSVGDMTTVVAQFTAGQSSNPQYQWSSAMESRGEAVIVSVGDTLKIVYLSKGMDTVSVVLTTDYGSDSTAAGFTVYASVVKTFPWHEGFENGFVNWEMPTSGYNVWDLRSTGAHSGQFVACATDHDSYHPFDTLVSPPIVVPSNAHGLKLFWWMKRDNSIYEMMNYRQIVVKPLNAFIPVWSMADTLFFIHGASFTTTYQQYVIDLEPFAGQNIRLAWAGSSYEGGKYIYIDDIEIRYVNVPVGSLATSSTMVYEGDTLSATVTLIEGDTANLNYQWESTMANMALADIIGSGPQVDIAYGGIGIDTIVVTVSNAYGSFSDTTIVRVCSVQDSLPWVVDFGNELPCWQVLDGTCEVDNNGYMLLRGTVASPPLLVPSDGNVVIEYDCAYSFFSGSYLVMVTTDMVTFDTVGNFPFVAGTHPTQRIPITAYAGQQIRVVFKAIGNYLQFYLLYMNIRYALEPVVMLTVDDGYFPGTPMEITANLLEGDTNGITYIFTSAKAQNGEATLVQDGSAHATLTCYTGGLDTVKVVVTNSYGSHTDMTVVNVKPCDTVDALLWTENFDNFYTCWWLPEGSIWDYPVDSSSNKIALIMNAFHSSGSWLVSRAITLPNLPINGNDELMLCWDAAAMYAYEHAYSVMVTTAPDYRDLSTYDTLIYLDTVYPSFYNGMSTMQASLSDYAGQTVHLAFLYPAVHASPYLTLGLLIIDNVRIIDTNTTIGPPEPDTVWHTVTVLSSDSSLGIVSGGGIYMDSTWATITATPFEGYHFALWNDGDITNPRQIFVTSDTAFAAFFAIDTIPSTPDTVWHTVSVTANVEGVCDPYGSGDYADSSTVEIGYYLLDTTTHGGYWQLVGWSDGGTGNPRYIFVTSDTAIVAHFEWVPDSTDGIDGLSTLNPHFSIYPNPTHGDVTIEIPQAFSQSSDQAMTFTVIDMTGRVVIPPTVINSSFRIPHFSLPSGVYFVRVGYNVRKLVVK